MGLDSDYWLVLDSCATRVGVGVFQGTRCLAQICQPMQRGHAEALPLLTQDVLQRAGITASALASIAVTIGPGSFTGVRVGVGFARGLSLATKKPVHGVTVFAALAQQVALSQSTKSRKTLEVWIDARRNQLYYQSFAWSKAGLSVMNEPCVLDVSEAKTRTTYQRSKVYIGNGVALLEQKEIVSETASDWPSLDAILHVALLQASQASITQAAPLYLRAPDAKPIVTAP